MTTVVIAPRFDPTGTVRVEIDAERREVVVIDEGELFRYVLDEREPARLGWTLVTEPDVGCPTARPIDASRATRQAATVGEVVNRCLRDWDAEQAVADVTLAAAARAERTPKSRGFFVPPWTRQARRRGECRPCQRVSSRTRVRPGSLQLMPPHVHAAAIVALLRAGRRRWPEYADLVEEAGSGTAVLEAELARDEPAPRLFGEETAAPDLAAIAVEIDAWERDGMRLLTVLDPEYPENLRSVHDRPPLVFVAGRLESRDARSVAVVGTRSASDRGLEQARAIAEHLVDTGYTVVSGLAAGIDAAAHRAALERGGRTVAVVGTGLRRCYPAQNAALQRTIASECAVLSQFWPDAPPTRRSFPMRNAVMSGFALATAVVEASRTSGARMQARLALEHGRPVFLLESLLEHEWAREYAARPGTHVVQSPQEITTVVDRLTTPGVLVA